MITGTGNDAITTGAGDDTYIFEPSYGLDSVTDSGGNDTFDFSRISSNLSVTASDPTFVSKSLTVASSDGTVTYPDITIETFLSGTGSDTFTIYNYDQLTIDDPAGNETYHFFGGGSANITLIDHSPAGNTDQLDVAGTPLGDTATLSSGGFKYNNLNVLISALTSASLLSAQSTVNILMGDGDNILYVIGTYAARAWQVTSGTGSDTFYIGLDASLGPNMVQNISSLLTLVAGDGAGLDKLFIQNGKSPADPLGTLTADTITGFGLGQSIIYQQFEELTATLGSGDNTFTVTSTHPGTLTTLHGGGGIDTITIESTSSELDVDTGAGADVIVVNGTCGTGLIDAGKDNDLIIINGSGGTTTVNGSAGNDTININGSGGATTVNGGDGADAINITGSGGTTTVNGNGGDDTINIRMTGGDTTLNGNDGLDTINLYGTGGNTWIYGGTETDYFNLYGSGGTTVVNGDDTDNSVTTYAACDSTKQNCPGDDRFFIQGAGGDLTVNGGWGADKYYVSSDAAKKLYTSSDGVYDDDGPNDSPLFTLAQLTGNLAGITGMLNIYANVGGNSGSVDGLYISDNGDTTGRTGIMTDTMLSGLGMGPGGGIAYHQINQLYVQAGSGPDTLNLKSLVTGFTAYFYAGKGDDTLNASNDNHLLKDIVGVIYFYGEDGQDVVNADDSGNATSTITGQVTEEGLSGLGMGTDTPGENHIYFADSVIDGATFDVATSSSNETVNIYLGTGNDTFHVDSVYPTWATNLYTGAGDDIVLVGATGTGLHTTHFGFVNFINGPLHIDGQDGSDQVVVDDAGNGTAQTGYYADATITGLGMTGAIQYSGVEDLQIKLGAQNDTFYVRGVPLNQVTTLNMGGGFDTVFLGDSHNSLDGFLGTLVEEGGDPSAGDNLYIHDEGTLVDAATHAGKTYTIDRAFYKIVNLTDGGTLDRTTITRDGQDVVKYDTTETVVLRTTSGNDVINLCAPQREEDPLGGHGSTFTLMAGAGDDILNLGKPIGDAALNQWSLGLIDILVMVDMGIGNDEVRFTQNTSVVEGPSGVLTTDTTLGYSLAFVRYTFDQIFPIDTTTWLATYDDPNIFGASVQDSSLFSGILLGFNTTQGGNVMDMGLHVRNTEKWSATLSDNADVFHLFTGRYDVAIEVNAAGGNDTFNIDNGVANTLPITLDGGDGDDLFYVDYSSTSAINVSLIESTFIAARGTLVVPNVPMFDNQVYYVETRKNGSDWQFRMVDSSDSPVKVGKILGGATDLIDVTDSSQGWQSVSAIGKDSQNQYPFDTKRGTILIFGSDFTKYKTATKDHGAGVFTFLYGAPQAQDMTLTINGDGQSTQGDMLRFSGDKVARGVYKPSATTSRAGQVLINSNLFNFTGIEPLVIQGMASFNVITPDAPANLAVETINVKDMNLSDLVLHVVTVDGVITWRQQVILTGLAAPETTSFGQSMAMNDSTLVVGAARVGALSGVVYVYTRSGETWSEQAKLYAPDGNVAGIGFGSVVALYNDVVVVGAPNDNRMGANTGAAYVFYRNGNDWVSLGKLVIPDGRAGDLFGSSASVGPTPNGTTALIGAPGAKAAYFFAWDSSTSQVRLQSKIIGPDAFGTAVVLNYTQAIIGAPSSTNNGHVIIFQQGLMNGNPAWLKVQTIQNTDTPQTGNWDQFGSALACDGNWLVVGAPGFNGTYANTNEIGAAWVYDTTSWALLARLTSYDALPEIQAQDNVLAGYHFGASVGISGNYVIVGAPDFAQGSQGQGAAYLFTYLPATDGVDGTWTRSNRIITTSPAQNDHFSKSVAVYGSRIVVGMPGYDDTATSRTDLGRIYFYATNGIINLNDSMDSSTGIYQAETVQVTGATAETGYKTLYDPLSGTLLVAAPKEGKVYVYKNEGLLWFLNQIISDLGKSSFGYAMDLFNNTLVVGEPNYNLVYIFHYSGSAWMPDGNGPIQGPQGSSGFGKAVAIDGTRIAVGAPDTNLWYASVNQGQADYHLQLLQSGAVFTYTLINNIWTRERFVMPYDPAMPEVTSILITSSTLTQLVPYACVYEDIGINCGGAGYISYLWTIGRSAVLQPLTHLHCTLSGNNAQNNDGYSPLHVNVFCDGNMEVSAVNGGIRVDTQSTIQQNTFNGLDNEHFGAVLDLQSGSLLIGGNGNTKKLYMVDLSAATDPSWITPFDAAFGKPLRATFYQPTSSEVTDILITSSGQALIGFNSAPGGSVKVYTGGGTSWSVLSTLGNTFGHTADDQIGAINTITSNGVYTLVGGPGADKYGLDTGMVLFYTGGNNYTLDNWVPGSGDASIVGFGQGPLVISEGHYLAGSTDSIRLFNYRQSGPTFIPTAQASLSPAPLPTAEIGSSVAIAGNVAVVGARDYDGRGAVFIFTRTNPNTDAWTQTAKIQSLDLHPGDEFGASVAVNSGIIIVGAPNNQGSGAVYVFTLSGSTWVESLRLSNALGGSHFGTAVDIYANTIVVGAPDANLAYVYLQASNSWKLSKTFSAPNGNFGAAVSVNGNTMLVGAPLANKVYVYGLTGSTWLQTTTWTGNSGTGFGTAVDVSGDWAVVGAPNDTSNTGLAYVFNRPDSITWNVLLSSAQVLSLTSGLPDDYFGQAVSIDGTRLVVGAYKRAVNVDPNIFANEGSVYAYGLKNSAWQLQTLPNPLYASNGASGDSMGYSVAISGTLVVAGAPQMESIVKNANGEGYIYISEIGPSTTVIYPAVQTTVLDGAKANYVSGTVGKDTGGKDIEICKTYYFDDVSVTLDTSNGNHPDKITIYTGIQSYGMSSFNLVTGAGDDEVIIKKPDMSMQTEGSYTSDSSVLNLTPGAKLSNGDAKNLYSALTPNFTFNGGDPSGNDSLTIDGDANFTLLVDNSVDHLLSSAGGSIYLTNVGRLKINGGPGPNTFDVQSWNGDVTLDGLDGSDYYMVNLAQANDVHISDTGTGTDDEDRVLVRMSAGNDVITPTSTDITLGSNQVTYSGVEVLLMSGMDGNDTFNINDISGIVVGMDGNEGSDIFNINVSNATSNIYIIDNGLTGADTLNILGSNNADTFVLGSTLITVNTNGVIHYNDSLEFVNVNGLGGNDIFSVNGNSNASTSLYGGNGDDTFTFNAVNANGILADGQEGSDTYDVPVGSILLGPVYAYDTGILGDPDYVMSYGTENADTVVLSETGITLNGVVIYRVGTFDSNSLRLSGIEGTKLDLLGGDDSITVDAAPNNIAVYILGGAGNDIFTVPDLSTLYDGSELYGLRLDGGLDNNNLILNASGNGVSGTYNTDVNSDNMTGLGMLGSTPIFFINVMLTINLTNGNDNLTITGTHQDSQTTINGLDGEDTFIVESIGLNSQLNLDGQEGSDNYAVPLTTSGQIIITDTGTGINDIDYIAFLATQAADTAVLSETDITVNNLKIYTVGSFNSSSLQVSGVEGTKLYLLGGDDSVTVNGVPDSIPVFIMGGAGNDTFTIPDLSTLYDGSELHGLRLDGGAGTNDLFLNASGNGVTGTYFPGSNERIEGLGLQANPLYFTNFNLTLNLTSGDDNLTLTGTDPNCLTTINGLDGKDTIIVQSTSLNSQLTLNGGNNNDTFIIDSATHSLNAFMGAIFVNGNGNDSGSDNVLTILGQSNSISGGDTLTIRDDGSSSGNIYTLNANSLQVNSLLITISTLESLYLNTGTGNNVINVQSTPDASSTYINQGGGSTGIDTLTVTTTGSSANLWVSLGAGDDTVAGLGTGSGAFVDLLGGDGSDTFTVQSTGLNSYLQLDGGNNSDSFILGNAANSMDDFQGQVLINGDANDSGSDISVTAPGVTNANPAGDVLTIRDDGDSSSNIYTLTATTLQRNADPLITTANVETLYLNTGIGNDAINVQTTADTSNTFINQTGANTGVDTLTITTTGSNANLSALLGDGNDVVSILTTGSDANLYLSLGNGSDSFSILTTGTNAGLWASLDTGDDTAAISTTGTGSFTYIFGNDGSDTFTVLGTGLSHLLLDGGNNNDSFILGNLAHSMDDFLGLVLINGDTNDATVDNTLTIPGQTNNNPTGDVLTIRDDGDISNNSYIVNGTTYNYKGKDITLTNPTLQRSSNLPIVYCTVETLVLDTGSGDNTVTVQTTVDAGNTFINRDGTHPGVDTLSIVTTGSNSNLWASLGAGNDAVTITTTGNGAYVSIQGGDGNDAFGVDGNGTSSQTALYGNAGLDTFHLTGSVVGLSVYGGTEADSVVFDDGVSLTGLIDGGADHNTLDFSRYITGLTVNLSNNSASPINGGVASGFVNFANLIGGAGNDVLTGDNQDNTINGSAGNDTINGMGGNDTLIGGPGDDTFVFSSGFGQDIVVENSGEGNDTLDFSAFTTALTVVPGSSVTVSDGLGNSMTHNQNQIETLKLGSGNNRVAPTNGGQFFGGAGTIQAGSGVDTLDYSAYTSGVTVNLAAGTAQGIGTVSGFENIMGGSGNDTLTGDAGNNVFFADPGDDTLNGMGGVDTFDASASRDNLIVNLTAGTSTSDHSDPGTDPGMDTLLNIENVNTGSGNDSLTGGPGDNVLNGGSGNDTYTIGDGGGSDTIIDSAGNDTLSFAGASNAVAFNLAASTATSGTNTVSYSGSIIETLEGGNGDDTFQINGTPSANLKGGPGNDRFVFQNGAVLTGVIDGQSGSDMLDYSDWTTARSFTLTGLGTIDGFDGSPANITGGFSNVDGLVGGGLSDTLNGLDSALTSTWVFAPAGNSYQNNGHTLGFASFETLNGGSGNDVFAFSGNATFNGTLSGGNGSNTLDDSGYGSGCSITLTGLGSVAGFNGSQASISGGFQNISGLIGSAYVDTLTGRNTPSSWNINVSNTYNSIRTLGFSAVEELVGGSNVDVFTVTGNQTADLFGGQGDDIFNLASGAALNGSLDGQGGTDQLSYSAWNSTVTVNLASGTATGTSGIANIESVLGGSGNDNLTADSLGDVLDGGAGNDSLTSGSGNDTLIGGPGNDTYHFTDNWGTDTVIELSGAGTDRLDFSSATSALLFLINNGVTVTSGVNSATQSGGLNVENLVGGSTGDTFKFSESAYLNGSIDGRAGYDILDYTNCASMRSFTLTALGSVDGFAGTGNSMLVGFDNIQQILGGAGRDHLVGLNTPSEWHINGKTGQYIDLNSMRTLDFTLEDVIGGGGSFNVFNLSGDVEGDVIGTALDDVFIIQPGATFKGKIDGLSGNDALDLTYRNDPLNVTMTGLSSIFGLSGVLTGTNLTVYFDNINGIIGGSGMNDTFTGRDADATWTWKANGDNVYQSGGGTTAFRGFENLQGGSGVDQFVISGTQNENIFGGAGGDTFSLLNGAMLNGFLDGQAGTDTLDYSAWTSGMTVNLLANPGAQYPGSAQGILNGVINVENLVGGSGNDTLSGDNGDNVINGGPGDDILSGGAGNDTYLFNNNWGSDVVYENANGGQDTLNFSQVSSDLLIVFGSVTVTSGGNQMQYLGNDIEQVIGGSGNDTFRFGDGITFNHGHGVIDGGSGSDLLDFSSYTNAITVDFNNGRATGLGSFIGFEKLTAGSGDDIVYADDPTLMLDGGSGKDTLFTSTKNYIRFLNFESIIYTGPEPSTEPEKKPYIPRRINIVWALKSIEAALRPDQVNLVVYTIPGLLLKEFDLIDSNLVDRIRSMRIDLLELPGNLPAGLTYVNAVQIDLYGSGTPVRDLESWASVMSAFPVPAGIDPGRLVVLYWNPALDGGKGGWERLHPTLLSYQGQGKWVIDTERMQLLQLALEEMVAQNRLDLTKELCSLAVVDIKSGGLYVLALAPLVNN